jgi:DNA-binding transcriptional LysR family regulator
MTRLRLMRYFVTVADEGQITRAARTLHLVQPALSQAIAQLEEELGLKLLERHARGVRLTPAGAAFLEKARIAVAAAAEAELAARSASTRRGVVQFGFLGVPPALDSPGPFEDLAQRYPEIELHFRELPFPSAPTKTWLSEVDVAVCHLPPSDPDVWRETLRREPRVVLAPRKHPLAQQSGLRVADVLDETFIGFHPSVEPSWAGFWSLDDHRGGPPAHVTPDGVENPQEVLASLGVRSAITTVPASVAQAVANLLTGVVAIPLDDADPVTITFVGHERSDNPHVASLRGYARGIRPS